MRNNFQSNGSRGTFLGLSKDYGLGLPRHWKVITTTLLLLFTLSIGQMWATDFTFSGAYNGTGNGSWNTTTSTTPIVTVTKDISNGSVGISCVSSSNVAYPKINGNAKYIKFSVPEGYRITNVNVTWRANTSDQKIIAIFGESLSSISNSVLTATNGGYVISSALSASGNTTCDNGEDLAISASHNAREVMLVRIMTYNSTTYANGNTKYTSFPCKFSSSSSDSYPTVVGKANDVNIGQVILTVESTGGSSSVAPTISAPTTDQSASYTVGDAITALSITASGTPTPTYQWYYNSSASTTGATSLGSSAQSASYTPANDVASDLYYYCVATNSAGSATSHYFHVTVSAPSTPTHGISYTNLKGSDVSAYPTTYYEGTGIASFDPLADVTDFHFNGWSPASISASATTDQTISATWVAAYNVSFNAGAGGGTVPTSFQKWQGAKFNLPGQGSMTAPSGKVFDGWKANGAGDKLAANAEYTMGNAAVEFVAQWKAVPQTIYSLTVTNTSSVNLNNGGAQNDLADDATIVGGGAYMQNDHANNAQQILGSTKLQFKAGTVTLVMTLDNALKEGDTIKATGLNSEGLCFGVTFNRSGSLDNQLASDASYFVVPEEFEGKTTLYAWRHSGSGTTCASIIIRRPADRPISSTEISLSDLKVNNRSIHSDSLAMLKTGPAYSLHLGEEFTVAPVIKFNRHKVITFADSEEPTQAIYDRAYSVTATTVSSQWQAAQEINDITYTVTATKITSYTVAYKDENGTTSLGSEVVAVGEHPTASGITAKKAYHSFAGWTLSGNPVELTGVSAEAGETVTLVASYTPAYATSVNIEQWVLDNSKNNTAFRVVLNERHYTYSNLNDLDSLTTAKNETDRNEPYLGQKWKKNNSEIGFLLKSGSTVRAKFGYVGDNVNIKIGSADAITKTAAQLETPYEYTASEDVIIKLQGTGENTVVVKQIMIDEAIATVKLHAIVTYDAGTGSYGKENEKYTGTPLVIGNATPVTDSIFAGWYLGDDQIDATAYVPTKNVTLQARYAPKEYAIAYDGNGATSGSMTAGAAGWGTMVTPDANAFEKTGHVFSGWEITKTSDGSATGITFSEGKFEMPKYDVTLVAQWDDVSKVAIIVDTNVKYESLAEAIAAATDGQTIQLLQNNNVTAQVEVAGKAITLDLAGYKIEYTGTDLLPSGVILVHNGASLTINDSSDPDAGSIVSGDNAYAAIALTKAGDDATNPAILVINGGIITGDYYAITGHGSRHNTQITINGGTISGAHANDNSAIYHPQQGTLTVNNGTLTGYSAAIEMRAGTLVINGGTFTATATTYSCDPNGSGTTTVGAAIAIAQHNTQKEISVTINGGTFEGVKAINEANPQNNPTSAVEEIDIAVKGGDFTGAVTTVDVDHFISGGTFDAPVSNKNSAEGFVPAAADPVTGKYSVKPKDGVSIIKAVATNKSQDITGDKLTGIYKGAAHIETATDYKLNEGKYFMVQLEEGKNFQAGDIVKINVSAVNDCNGFTLYSSDEFIAANLIIDTHEDSSTPAKVSEGINEVELPSSYLGSNKLYVARADGADKYLNAGINQVEVVRVIYPTLTAITFNDVAATKGTGNAFSVTLPEEGTNLASMTVVPTIIRNAAHATTPEAVVSNEGAWVAGDNTYRVMDKDNDYTDYTITITLQGNAETPSITDQPQTQSYCAGSEPTLSVTASVTDGGTLHYAWFKEAGANDEAVGEDAASYTIASAGTYYVIVTNKVDGKLDASVTSDNAVITLNTPASITTQPSDLKKQIEGANITLSVVAANATAYQWYSCDNKDKENPSLIAGADEAEYEFAAAAGFFYCEVTGLCGTIESNVAEVTIKRTAGCQYINATSGSQANLTDGTIMYACGSDGKLLTGDNFAEASSNAKAIDADAVGSINKQYCVVKFPADVEEITLFGYNGSNREINNLCIGDAVGTDIKVNTAFTAYTKSKANDGYERSMTIEFDEPFAKEKYLFIKYNSALEIYRICYTEAIEKPVIATQPATKIDFAAGDMTATVVVSDVTEGTLKYQWYNADGDVEVEGATEATLTTTTEGTYYVIVRNTLAGHKDYAVKSSEATLAYRQANDATLSALTVSAGALDPTFDKAVVEYRVDLPKNTTTVPTLTATATMAAYGATAVVTNAAEFENYEAISTVLVTAEDHTTQKTYTVHYYVAHTVTTLADVTESTTWDWSLVTKKADGTTISGDGPKLDENEDGLILASYLSGDDFDKLEGNHNAYAIRNSTDKKVYQGASLRMHTTKGGYLSIWAANEGNSMTLNVANAGRDMQIATLTGSQVEYKLYVQAGDVRIYNVSSASKPMRVSKIVFTVDETPDYTRDQMLGAGVYGTICLPYNVPAGGAFGATFYEMAGRNPENGKIVMDEVTALEAGVPYVFEAHGDIINVFYGETHVENPVNKDNGMYGTFVDQTLTELDDVYYFAQRALWGCADLTSLNLPANRAYVKLSEVDYLEPNSAPAPGRRRITFSVNGEQTATGIDALNAEDAPVKMMINGQIFILRGEKMYDATGKLVK